MKADFGTLSAVLAFILNASGFAGLYHLLTRPEAVEAEKDLQAATTKDLTDARPDRKFVARKVKALGAQLFSVWMLLLHLLNIAILVALFFVLLLGPENVFSKAEGELAEPLTPAQTFLYWSWLLLGVVGYTIKGMSPTVKWLRLWRRGKAWLCEEDSRRGIRKQ